jgi:hypothetical protein
VSDLGYCPECGDPGVRQVRLHGDTKCLRGHIYPSERFNPPTHRAPKEALIEDYFVGAVTRSGGMTRKVKWLGVDGAPDRMAGWPNGRNGFVELKRPKGVAEAHQAREHRRMREIGFRVDVLDTKAAIDLWVSEMAGEKL